MVSATSLLLGAVCALALATAASLCNEQTLERDAMKLLLDHVDAELGGVGAGKSEVVGFQYLVLPSPNKLTLTDCLQLYLY